MAIQLEQVIDAQPVDAVVTILNSGSPPYSFSSNPGTLFALGNVNEISINVALSAGETSITILDANGEAITITYDVINPTPTWTPGQRPFTANSLINLPLGLNIPLQRLPWAPPSIDPDGIYTAGNRFYFDIPDPTSAPLVTIDDTGPGNWGNPPVTPNPMFMTAGFAGVPDGGDMIGIVVINNIATDFEGLQRPGKHTPTDPTTASCFGYGQANMLTNDGFGYLTPYNGGPNGTHAAGPVATGASSFAGAMLKQEYTQNAEILHALSVLLYTGYCTTGPKGYGTAYPPSLSNDGSSVNGIISEGQFLAIPKTASLPAGLSAYGAQTFTALQNYGCYLNDSGGGSALLGGSAPVGPYAATSWTHTDIYTTPGLESDAVILFPMLCKVGYVMDGYIALFFPWACCGPQTAQVAYSNQALLNLTRDIDGINRDILPLTTDVSGNLDQGRIAGLCVGTIGRVAKYYSQGFYYSFSSEFVAFGAANPITYQSGAQVLLGGQPAMLFDGSSNYFKDTTALALQDTPPPVPLYYKVAFQISGYSGNAALYGSDVSGGLELRIQETTGYLELCTNTGRSIAVASLAQVPLNVPLIASFFYNYNLTQYSGAPFPSTPGEYGIYLNGTPLVAGTDATPVQTNGGHVMVGASGPTPTDFFDGMISAWTVCGQPQPNPQFVIEQYDIDFFSATTVIILTLASDTFTDTNGTLLPAHTMNVGSGWTDLVGSHYIQSNSAQPDTLVSGGYVVGVGSTSHAIATFNPGQANGTYQITMTPIGTAGNANFSIPSLILRLTDANNYLSIQLDTYNNDIWLFEFSGGSPSSLAQIGYGFTSGTAVTIKIILNAGTVAIYVNGTHQYTAPTTVYETNTVMGIQSIDAGTPASKCVFDTLTFTTATS